MSDKIKVVGYVRVSTDMQARKEFSSIEVQTRIIKDYVANHEEYELVEVFADEGKSAKNMNRPEIRRLMERIQKDDIRIVLSYRLDRVSREKLSFYQFEDLLRQHNVQLIYTNDVNFEDTPSGNLAKGVIIAASQYERESTAQRIRDKYNESLKVGYRPGSFPPLGYKNGEKPKTIEISSNAKYIREIYSMYLDGKRPCEIYVHMNAVYGATPQWYSKNGNLRGGGLYTQTFIERVLSNPTYAGYVFRTNKDGSKQLFEGLHKPIINRSDWEKVQEKLALDKENKNAKEADDTPKIRERNPYILKKLLFCSCGANMTVGGSGKKRPDGSEYYYYVCSRKKHTASYCKCDTAIALYIIEDIVFSAIGYIATQDVRVKEVKDANTEYKLSLEKEQETLRREISALDKSVQSALEKFAELGDDPYIKSAVQKNLKEKSKSLATMRSRLEEVNAELARFRERMDIGDFQIKASIENLEYCRTMLTHEQKVEILKQTVSKLVLTVKSREGFKRVCLLTIFPVDENMTPVVVEFAVDNSQGRGMWRILSPFSLDSGRTELKKMRNNKIKQHFLHNVVKWKKEIELEDLAIRELAKRLEIKSGMLGRQLKLLKDLSEGAVMFILKLRYQRDTDKLTFRKLEMISKQPQFRHLKLIKTLLGK